VDLGINWIDLLEALADTPLGLFGKLTVLRQISVSMLHSGFTRLASCFSFSYQTFRDVSMPTINQLVRQGREVEDQVKSPAMENSPQRAVFAPVCTNRRSLSAA
jgi:hypothetical protein